MRDNALVMALRELGHDALMAPLYLQPALDEESAAANAPLFYGGINVYLQEKFPLFRRTPRWLDRLFDSRPVLKAAARKAGMTSASQLGELTVSTLRGEDGRQAKELNRLVDWLASYGRADVVCLSNILLIGLARRIKERTGAAVVCTLQGEDTFLDSLPEAESKLAWKTVGERAHDVDAFIAVSKYHADLMCDRGQLPSDRVHVVHNGISLDGYEPRVSPRHEGPPVLGYLARMYRPKGLEALVDAFITLRGRDRVKNLKLRVAGSRTEADSTFVTRLRERLATAGLEADVEFLENVSRIEKIAFLQTLDVLSVPAIYGESFGLYVIEALAAGVPVVQPRHAAFPELIEATGGGILYDPDDPIALVFALEELLLDPERARSLGEQGRQSVHECFSVERMAENVLRIFEGATLRKRADGLRV